MGDPVWVRFKALIDAHKPALSPDDEAFSHTRFWNECTIYLRLVSCGYVVILVSESRRLPHTSSINRYESQPCISCNDSTNPIDLWCTVAYKLTCGYHIRRGSLISKLKNDGFSLADAAAQGILEDLVVTPLQHLVELSKDFSCGCLPVFVIDALDECGSLSSASGPHAKSRHRSHNERN